MQNIPKPLLALIGESVFHVQLLAWTAPGLVVCSPGNVSSGSLFCSSHAIGGPGNVVRPGLWSIVYNAPGVGAEGRSGGIITTVLGQEGIWVSLLLLLSNVSFEFGLPAAY